MLQPTPRIAEGPGSQAIAEDRPEAPRHPTGLRIVEEVEPAAEGGSLPSDEPEELGEVEESPRSILITGANGPIGRVLRAAWEGFYDLILLDGGAPDGEGLIVADLADWDETWVAHFDGVDTVIHLAGDLVDPDDWGGLVRSHLDVLANVLNASAFGGVERVVFASSARAMAGYRHVGEGPITVDLPPRPDGPEGILRLVGERLGRSLAHAFDLSFVALRLGTVRPGEAGLDGEADGETDDWARQLRLSEDDLVDLFEAAVEADLSGRPFLVANAVSQNPGMRWDLSEAIQQLGFQPNDDPAPGPSEP